MKTICLSANAKINLSLDVIAKRPDGYHDLATIMQAIDLADTIKINLKSSAQIEVTTDCAAFCDVKDNLAYRAAHRFNDYFNIKSGYHIDVIKRIPLGAGLAGGSADAAAVLRGLATLHGLAVDDTALLDLAAKLGADVPFCLVGGTALAEGIGEHLTPLANNLQYYLVLVKPPQAISTAQVFKSFDLMTDLVRPDNVALIKALQAGNLGAAIAQMGNVLENVTTKWLPQIEQIKSELYAVDADYAQMTGSGSTVFAIFADEDSAVRAKRELSKKWRDVYLTKPIG